MNTAAALLNSLGPAPTAAPTRSFCFFTFLISKICFFISKFLWIIPIPPAFAIAIAILLSVTVSIAEDNKGIFNSLLISTAEITESVLVLIVSSLCVSQYSKSVRAGKRTYFFDVKSTRSGDHYLTITESKKKFDQDGNFHFEKHKIFLYKEDFEKFKDGLHEVVDKVISLNENISNNSEDSLESKSFKNLD